MAWARELVAVVGRGSSKKLEDTVIDMSKANQSLTTASDLSLTFENASDGSVTVLSVFNYDTIAHSVSFVDGSGVSISVVDAATGVNPDTWTIYQIEKNTVGLFIQVLSVDSINPFLTGSDGDLIILNGQNVDLNAGDIKDYNNVDIQAGGTLTILDPSNTGALVEIYTAGTFNIDGEIIGRDTENNGGSYSGNTTIGSSYSFTVTQSIGGSGGNATGSSGGAGTNGYGGGGAGGRTVSGAQVANGGNGGSNNGNGANGAINAGSPQFLTPGFGGAGNSTQGDGLNGLTGFYSSDISQTSGRNGGAGGGSGGGGGGLLEDSLNQPGSAGSSGGGGGQKGFHGANLFLYCTTSITGSGTINLSGLDGFNGGNGGSAWSSGGDSGGAAGGGGGGAGGSGGNLIYTAPALNPTVDVSGGSGGTAGNNSASGGTAGSNGGIQII